MIVSTLRLRPTRRRVAAALGLLGLAGLIVPAGADRAVAANGSPPVGFDASAEVQPGGLVTSEVGVCTLNFLFTGSDGNRYIGTAGHCILASRTDDGSTGPSEQERIWSAGSGPETAGFDGRRIGEFAYAILDDARPTDFALIRLDPGVEAKPEMAFFGGPTGINTDRSPDPVQLEFYGNGVGAGLVVPGRTVLALTGMQSPDYVFATGQAGPGDSGSGVISADGRAVGVLVSGGPFFRAPSPTREPEAGVINITRLEPQVSRAGEVLGLDLTLVTPD